MSLADEFARQAAAAVEPEEEPPARWPPCIRCRRVAVPGLVCAAEICPWHRVGEGATRAIIDPSA